MGRKKAPRRGGAVPEVLFGVAVAATALPGRAPPGRCLLGRNRRCGNCGFPAAGCLSV